MGDVLEYSFCARQIVAERVSFHRHPYGFGECLENGFDLVVLVLAIAFDVQVAFGGVGEGLEEMEEHGYDRCARLGDEALAA